MEMKKSESGIKKFTQLEKLNIIKEVREKGLQQTLLKYDLYPATYYYWKRKYESYGEIGLNHKKNRDQDKIHKLLLAENQRLKLILADRELELEMKNQLLKKMYPETKKKRW